LWSCDGLNPLIYASPVYGDGAVIAMGGFFGSSMAVKPGGQWDVIKTAPSVVRAALEKEPAWLVRHFWRIHLVRQHGRLR